MMILLDIDDTLIDHSKAERVASIEFGKQFSSQIPDYLKGSFEDRWREESQKHIDLFLRGEISFQKQRRERIRGVFGDHSISDSQADKVFENYLQHYEDSWELFQDVIPFLEKFRSWKCAILSDGSQDQQELKLERTGIRQYFDFVLTAESEGMSKPNPSFFVKACDLASADPSETFYIGDNLTKDAIGASNAGLIGVWLNRNGMKTDLKIYAIETLSDFEP